jgi:hypothetical protein
MKSSLLTSIKALGLLAALTSVSFALPITGSIGFVGPYSANNPDLTLATQISFNNTVNPATDIQVSGLHTGSFASVMTGSHVTMFTPLQVNGLMDAVTLPGGPIWSVGGFSLTLTSIWETFNDDSTLNIRGVGVLSNGNEADDSIGAWVATFNTAGENFTFSASATAVPDGGTTAMLLGAALLAIGAFARRSVKA